LVPIPDIAILMWRNFRVTDIQKYLTKKKQGGGVDRVHVYHKRRYFVATLQTGINNQT
jgi:hypothetical protein